VGVGVADLKMMAAADDDDDHDLEDSSCLPSRAEVAVVVASLLLSERVGKILQLSSCYASQLISSPL
jgi:hypothetical protein